MLLRQQFHLLQTCHSLSFTQLLCARFASAGVCSTETASAVFWHWAIQTKAPPHHHPMICQGFKLSWNILKETSHEIWRSMLQSVIFVVSKLRLYPVSDYSTSLSKSYSSPDASKKLPSCWSADHWPRAPRPKPSHPIPALRQWRKFQWKMLRSWIS